MIKKLTFLIVIALSCLSGSLYAQRFVTTLNEAWKFNKSDDARYAKPEFNDSKWETVTIPHCWNAEDALQTSNYYRGPGWYRKNLNLSPSPDKRYLLHFEGASIVTDIFVNGEKAGSHEGGYTAFSFDITPFLRTGTNEIAIRVNNASRNDIPPYSGDFTFWGGLYRDVYLVETNPVHFRTDNNGSKGIFFETPSVSEKTAHLIVRGELTNDLSSAEKLRVVASLQDATGKEVGSFSSPLKVSGKTTAAFNLKTDLTAPHLWSPADPYLYHMVVRIVEPSSGKVLDELTDHLGIRWFSADTQNGFMLNGKPLKLLGVCRHQDYVGLGSALTNDMHRRDARLIKEMGANFIRIAHYPQDPAFLDACDEEGILAWEEIPIVNYVPDNKGFADNSKKNLTEMIRQHYNHPAVVMWGYMNEVLLQSDFNEKEKPVKEKTAQRTVALAKELEHIVRTEDPGRLSTIAWHNSQIYNQSGMGDVPNIIGWNMYSGGPANGFIDFGRQMDNDHNKYPNRPEFISEYGIGADKRVHTLHPSGYDYSCEYQQLFHESYMPQILARKFIIGSTVWNFIDFGSGFRQESTSHMNNKGLVYMNREPKDTYYYYKALLRTDPVIHIASRDWNERKGIAANDGDRFVSQPIKVYSNLSQVELFLNGKSLGIQRPSNRNTVYQVPFVNGDNVLEAKSAVADSLALDAMTVHFAVQPYDLRKAGKDIEIGINAGSNCFYNDSYSHLIYEPDQPYREGSWGYIDDTTKSQESHEVRIYSEIKATTQGPLFQTMREGVKTYKFDVPDGDYEVTLSFAVPVSHENAIVNNVWGNTSRVFSDRVFNVSVNDQTILQNLDLAGEDGSLTAVEKTFIVKATHGTGVAVNFSSVKGKTIVNALKIRRVN